MAVGRSYFEQLAPTGTVALGWSSIALHWLSAQPGPLSGIWPHLAPTVEREVWRAHAAADWAAFLSARAAELRPGRADGRRMRRRPPHGGSGAERVMQTLTELVHRDSVRRAVSAEVTERLGDPGVVPHRRGMAATVRRPGPPRPPCGWSTAEIVRLGDPLWEQTRSGDPEAYARAVAAAVRVSFGPSLLGPVPADQRDALSARLFDDALAAAISAADDRAVVPTGISSCSPPPPWPSLGHVGILDDKVAVVTGAARGIGRATLEVFLEEGARVVATDIDGDALSRTVAATGAARTGWSWSWATSRCRPTPRR